LPGTELKKKPLQILDCTLRYMQPMCVRVYLTCVFIFKTHEVCHTAPTEPGNVSTDYAIRHAGSAHIVDTHVVPGATEMHASPISCYMDGTVSLP